MEPGLTALVTRPDGSLRYLDKQINMVESYTGGGTTEAITRIPGSSGWFEADYVTCSNRQKTPQSEVPKSLFPAVSAVSRGVVEIVVRGAQQHSGACFAVTMSGIVEPSDDLPKKPIGTVWLAQASDKRLVSERCQFSDDRDAMRRQTVVVTLAGPLRMSNDEDPGQSRLRATARNILLIGGRRATCPVEQYCLLVRSFMIARPF